MGRFLDEPIIEGKGKFLDEPPQYNIADVVSEDKTINNGFIDRTKKAFGKWLEPSKMAAQGTETMLGSIGGLLNILGDQVKPNDDIRESYVDMGKDNKRLQFADKVGDYLKDWGNTAKTFWKDKSETGWEAEKDEELWEGTFFDNPSVLRAVSLGAGAIPSLGASVALGTAFGPVAGLTMLGLLEGEPVYEEAISKGATEEKATGLFLATAGMIAVTEKVPLDRFLKGGSGKLIKDIIVGGVMGGTQEGTQQYLTNVIRKYGIDDTVVLSEGVVDSVIAGVLSEGVMGGATSRKSNAKTNKVRNYVQTQIDELNAKAEEMGMSQEELDNLTDVIADTIVEKSDEIDKVIGDTINVLL